jgi:two-component system, LytTR family, sensor kinase
MTMFSGHPVYWLCQALFWFGLWVTSWLASKTDLNFHQSDVQFWIQTCLYAFGISDTHFIRCLYHWRRWWQLSWLSLLPRIFGICALLSCINSFLSNRMVVINMQMPSSLEQLPVSSMVIAATQSGITLVAWSAIYLLYQYQRRFKDSEVARLELNSAIKEAQLQALRFQVNPHFLFNCLNTIRSLVDENPHKAREAITKLSELLRASLRTSEKKVIPLREELHAVEAYLMLEKFRYEERLTVEMFVDPSAMETLLPPFLIQTLMENALKHGDYLAKNRRLVSCRISTIQEKVKIVVANPGSLNVDQPGNGTGLINATERLKMIYGLNAHLRLYASDDKKVTAEVELPRLWQIS